MPEELLNSIFRKREFGEASEYLPCWKSHYHVPQSAFTSLMKVFYLEKIENSLILSFSVVILCHQPKTLSRAVTLSAGIQGHSSEVNKSWPMNLQNLVYWLKKHEENKHHLGEKLWLVHKWKGERCNVNKLIVEERHVEDLLGLLTRTTKMRNNENADFF
ncbi:hypothetical protein NC653_000080 [Populus alba x Populus x berolinensis]|uniref:Uncharacterized protein n=1 Tax=Populus alba x Populus x berolinensis TaxID=444605 RepID=A0AAD6WG86_9ROSI|nr:hypothetical protein NC653_000080 [Populus alba x Populus x berolinensis]